MKEGDLVKIRGEKWEEVVEFTDRDMVGVVKSFPVDKIGEFSIYSKRELTILKRTERTKKSLSQISAQELAEKVAKGRVAFIERIRKND